jgi:hypothetical protein
VYAAMREAEPVIEILLSIAKSDPRHREVMKQTSKSNQLVFYEPVSSLCHKEFFHSMGSNL